MELTTNITKLREEIRKSVFAALETYSNVHRGSGHFSMVSTALYEECRNIVLDHLELSKKIFTVVFCSPIKTIDFENHIVGKEYFELTSQEIGLPIGVVAIAIRKKDLPSGTPFYSGGGTTKMISTKYIIWADHPDKFEAGTPAIINVITFARALQLMKKHDINSLSCDDSETLSLDKVFFSDDFDQYSGKELLEKLQQNLIGKDVVVPTIDGEKTFVNLDNSASTPTFDPIWDVYHNCWDLKPEYHQEAIDRAKQICSNFLHFNPSDYEVIFASNTTESLNLLADNLNAKKYDDIQPVVLGSMLEHTSNELPWRENTPYEYLRLSIDSNGFFDLKEIENQLQAYNEYKIHGNQRIVLVSICGASNVLGTCNDLKKIGEIVKKYGADFMIDAAQLVSHKPIFIDDFKPDFLVFSAHKAYAPFGSGAIIVRKEKLNYSDQRLVEIKSSGEENIAGILALAKALELMQKIGFDIIEQEEKELTKMAIEGLRSIDKLNQHGILNTTEELFNSRIGVVPFELKGKMPSKNSADLAYYNAIGVRYGCHCAHILVKHMMKVTPAIENLQWVIQKLFPKFKFMGVIRASIGLENTRKDIERLIDTVKILTEKKGSKEEKKDQMTQFIAERKLLVFGD